MRKRDRWLCFRLFHKESQFQETSESAMVVQGATGEHTEKPRFRGRGRGVGEGRVRKSQVYMGKPVGRSPNLPDTGEAVR